MALADSVFVIVAKIKATTLKITDKKASAELVYDKRAEKKSAAVVKNLVDPKKLSNILAVQTELRTYLASHTVPWLGDTYLLPKSQYLKFAEAVRNYKTKLDDEVDKFLRSYSDHIAEAHMELGDLFNRNDYPDVLDLRDKFSIDVYVQPMPHVNQFKELGLDEDTASKLEADALKAENDLLQKATEDLFERVKNRVSMLHNRMIDTETKRYRESLISGLQFLVDIMPDLNVTGDPRLNGVMDDIRKMLAGLSIEDVRNSEEIRTEVANQCDEIMSKMAGFM